MRCCCSLSRRLNEEAGSVLETREHLLRSLRLTVSRRRTRTATRVRVRLTVKQ